MIIDLMENDIIGPAIRQGFEQGFEQGWKEGLEQGRIEGGQRLLRIQIKKRFGPIPDWADARLASLSFAELETLADRIFDAPTVESLLS